MKRFFLWKMGFSVGKISPCATFTPPRTILLSLRQVFFDKLIPLLSNQQRDFYIQIESEIELCYTVKKSVNSVNVFVIHSSVDYNATDRIVSSLKQAAYSLNPLILKNSNCMWKLEASKKIRSSQMVLWVAGENSHKSPYIAWEIKESIKYKNRFIS